MTPPKSRSGGARSSPKLSALVTVAPGAKADDKRKLIIGAIKATGIPPRQAAMSVGVSSSAYYRMVDGDETFRAEIESATALFGRRMAAVIAKAAAGMGSWRAAAFWMERRWPESYGAKLDLHVEVEPSDEDRLDALYPTAEDLDAAIAENRRNALRNMSDEDLDALIAERKGRPS